MILPLNTSRRSWPPARLHSTPMRCWRGMAPLLLVLIALPGSARARALTGNTTQGPSANNAPQATPQARAAAQGAVPEAPATRTDRVRAHKAYQVARRAEQAADWQTAYAAYAEAASAEPSNNEYSALREHARFQWVQEFADRAER